uniref:Mannose receptor, C type 1b n=1 Tax=Seriola lalandi dorsalis TaxID=1841481 RepID=A0A3B4X378_SERLL
MLTIKITCTTLVLLIQTLQCLASDGTVFQLLVLNSPFQLTNRATGFCLVKIHNFCPEIRWTTGDRLMATWLNRCLGAQGKSVGSEVSLYECDENSELQKWECKNETVLALKGQELYIELNADNTAVLSKTIGPNNHLTISGTSSGACTRTYRELFTIGGNANGRTCMFPFMYKNEWYSDCTTVDVEEKHLWCSVETKFEHNIWGFCPTNSKLYWNQNIATGVYYQLNTQSALTWSQAVASCKQQGASLLSITDPHERVYIIGDKLWTGLTLDPEHGWQWSNGKPYRYLNWDSGHPLANPGENCAIIDGAVQYSWQSSVCTRKLGYICNSDGTLAPPTEAVETGFCSSPWIPYNGHCFHLNRTQKTWSDAQKACRKEGGDLVSIHNVEDQSFVISQLGYASTDELWIGLNDRKTEGLFDWTDHCTVSFTSWEFGKPSVFTDQENCVLIKGENGNWADRVCGEKHGFICMKTSATEPSGDEVEQNAGCKIGWKRHGSYCYFVGTETKTFDEAKDEMCHFICLNISRVDNAFLVSLVGLRPEKYFWLGLSNQKNIDQFVWTNTDSVRFTHWNAEMPGHRQGCVAMTTGFFAGLWDVLPCDNKEKYICKHLAEGAVLTPAPPTVPTTKCADGWTLVSSRKYCYKSFLETSLNKRTWYEARDYCMAIGGDLLSIHSTDDLKIYRTLWIGLSAPDPITGYVWSDGSPVNFQHWEDGEPNNKNNVESCAEFNPYNQERSGSWNDVQCEKYNGWICQILAEQLKINLTLHTSDGWLEWNGIQYYINEKWMAMEDARNFCHQRHGDLVTINSEAENGFLWKQVSSDINTALFTWWMDGSQAEFERWDEGQPNFNTFDENCAVMEHETGFWHDYNCGFEHKSICKRSGSPPANTTVAPTVPPKGGCVLPWKKMNSKVRAFLVTQMADTPTTDLWIGFHSFHGHQFYWSDGRPKSYVNLALNVNSPEPTVTTDYAKIMNDSIKAVTQPMTWDGAKKHCEDDDAKLASLRNEWSQVYVEWLALSLNTSLWIGINKMQVKSLSHGYFRYIDGWRMKLTSWGHNEPSPDRPCVFVDTDGKWKTAYCNQTMNSVCMKSTDVPPTESSLFPGVCPDDPDSLKIGEKYFWIPFKGYCYIFFTDEKEWASAAASCARHGGSLASIEDPSEQEFIQNNAKIYKDSHTSFWIGLYKTHKGDWLWLDNTVKDYTNWDEGQPTFQNHGAISASDGTWKTGAQWYDRPYICKTPKVGINPNHRGHIILAVVLVTAVIAVGGVIAFFLYKKSIRRLTIPGTLNTFDNPLFFSNEQSPPDTVDSGMKAEDVNHEPVITV